MGILDWFKKKQVYHKMRFDGVYYYSYFVDGPNEMRTMLYRFDDDGSVIRVPVSKDGWENEPNRILKWFTIKHFKDKKNKKRHLYTKYFLQNNDVSFTFKWIETSFKMSDNFIDSIKPIEERKSQHVKGHFLNIENDFHLSLIFPWGEKKLKFYDEYII